MMIPRIRVLLLGCQRRMRAYNIHVRERGENYVDELVDSKEDSNQKNILEMFKHGVFKKRIVILMRYT